MSFAPATFGKYFLLEKIATGGMAEIYRGKLLGPQGFEKQLVIKQIHPRFGSRPEFVQLFVAEAKTTVSLSHGNIVPIYELGVVDGIYFIAMEFVDGPTLFELVGAAARQGRRLAPAVAAFIANEVLKGLDYAHRKAAGIIHRDLSPRNVMVAREGEVKILDFGLAATLETAAAASAASSGNGRPVGSFPYMSPEQARREPLDPRSDLFSAGILLWEMLTGEALFARPDEDDTLTAVKTGPIPAPSSRGAAVPATLDAICLKALARDPAARFQNAAEFQAALGKFLYAADPSITAATLSALVSELCPDVPRVDSASPISDFDITTSHEEGGTRPMERGAGTAQQSFATHIELEKALVLNATPMMPFRALNLPPDPVRAPSRAPTPAPAPASVPPPARRNHAWLISIGIAIPLIVAAFVLSRRSGSSAPVVVAPDAAPRAPLPDAAPSAPLPDAAPEPDSPDAGTAPVVKRPPGKGRLIIAAPSVPWAHVYIDGKKVGQTPFDEQVAAGPHKILVKCEPNVCTRPDARFLIDVTAGGKARLDVFEP